MPKIETIILNCLNPAAQRQFYVDILGMNSSGDASLGYGGRQARLAFFQSSEPYKPEPNDVYWKIALAVPDIELAYRQLTDFGVTVSEPKQFRDIGYLAHLKDPEGFTIELVNHRFKDESPKVVFNSDKLGGGATLNLLTLRTANIEAAKVRLEEFGMKLLSIQPVESHGFTLYFYAFTDDVPPSNDPIALINRCWLYQRPYTVLEVQHLHEADGIAPPSAKRAGYAGTVFSGLAEKATCREFLIESRGYD